MSRRLVSRQRGAISQPPPWPLPDETRPASRKPAIKLWVDFGAPHGVKKTSAQVTAHYTPESLIGRQVLGVVNFPPRQIGPVLSEVLVLGVPDEEGAVVLIGPGHEVPLGGKLF